MPGVALFAEYRPGSVHDEGGRAEVAVVEVEQLGAVVHGDAATGDGVVLLGGLSRAVVGNFVHAAEEDIARFT